MAQIQVDTEDRAEAFKELAEAMVEHEDVEWWEVEDYLTTVRQHAQSK